MGDDGARAVELFAATGSSRFAAGAIELDRGETNLFLPEFFSSPPSTVGL